MKKWILLAIVIVVALFAYFKFVRVGPEKAFREFSEYWGANRLEKAWAYSVKDEVTEDFLNINQATGSMMESIMGITYTQKSITETGDQAEVTAELVVQFCPPGVNSAMMASHAAGFKLEGTVRKTKDGWKVVAFYPELKGVSEMGRR